MDWSTISLKLCTDRSDQEFWDCCKNHEIVVKGEAVPQPIQTFEQAKFPDNVLKCFYDDGLAKPTTIQAQGWPVVTSLAHLGTHAERTLYFSPFPDGLSLGKNPRICKFPQPCTYWDTWSNGFQLKIGKRFLYNRCFFYGVGAPI